MSTDSRPIPSRLLGRAISLARLYSREYHLILSVDLWYNGAAVMLRHPLDPPTKEENEGEVWRHIGKLPE